MIVWNDFFLQATIMKTLTVWLLCVFLAACSGTPTKPRLPDDATRVPVNRTMPVELQSGVGK